MVYQLLYVSTAIKDLSPGDIDEILEKSRENNQRNEITGVLLYADGGFIQLLEGPREVVEETYDRIRADQRHSKAMTLLSRDAKERAFPEWSMAYSELDFDAKSLFPLPDEGYDDKTPDQDVAKLLNTFLKVSDQRRRVA